MLVHVVFCVIQVVEYFPLLLRVLKVVISFLPSQFVLLTRVRLKRATAKLNKICDFLHCLFVKLTLLFSY